MASETKERERSVYRDDREADQARIESLEAELAAAQGKIAELEGKRSQALVLAGSKDIAPSGKATSAAAKWFGAPTRLELSRTWDKEFPIEKFEELIDVVREITGDSGRVELLKSSLSWSSSAGDSKNGVGPFINVRVTVRNGTTKLELSDRLGQLAGVWFGAIGGGVGGGAIVAPIFASIAVPVLAPVFILGWLGGFYALTRRGFKGSARKRAESLQKLFEALESDIANKLT